MKRIWVLLLALCTLQATAAVRTLQVTLGSGVTPILSVGAHQQVRWFVVQDNAAHAVRYGDVNITATRGLALSPSGTSFYVGPDSSASARDLGSAYLYGTSGDVIDVIYDDGE